MQEFFGLLTAIAAVGCFVGFVANTTRPKISFACMIAMIILVTVAIILCVN